MPNKLSSPLFSHRVAFISALLTGPFRRILDSDNLYPSYNKEHGIWVDHPPAVNDCLENYWNVVWDDSKGPEKDSADFAVSGFPVEVLVVTEK